MSRRNIITLAIIFLILAIWAGYYMWSGPERPAQNFSGASEVDLSHFTSTGVDRIIIEKKGEERKEFYKEKGFWKINGYDASQKEVEEFFETLKNVKIKGLASKNPANHGDFYATEEKGYILSLIHGKDKDVFIIGKWGPEFNSFYIKRKGSRNVYLASGLLRRKIQNSNNFWRDREIVNIPEDKIGKIVIKQKSRVKVIKRVKDGWEKEEKGKKEKMKESEVRKMLHIFNPLEANGFVGDKELKEYKKNKTTVTIFDRNGKKLHELKFSKRNGDWLVKVDNKDTNFKIYTYKISGLL